MFGSPPLTDDAEAPRCARSPTTSASPRSTGSRARGDHQARREGGRVPRARAAARARPRRTSPSSPTSRARARTSTTSAYALTVQRAVQRGVAAEAPRGDRRAARRRRSEYRDDAMLARTHGQPATPTTMGKELAVFVVPAGAACARRSRRASTSASSAARPARSPRTLVARPGRRLAAHLARVRRAASASTLNPLTTQIESHDWQAELYDRVAHANRILHNLATDIWTYISLGYFAPDARAGRHGLVDDAAQGQPDPLRERRGQPRARRRAARHARRDARHLPPAARPHRLDHAAQHRRRPRPLAARARQHPARARPDLARPASCCAPTSTRTGRCSPRRSRR